ncbi:DNA cytosine-5-methyltransferase, putative [Babesia ovis]|uniref:DNA cytosine-5-methyltransferase, putative n=1 Tax=Babesia ovis TaxID=5869 RepID=A0A9W5TEA8_BABOV|nr:DNA cytosine-5-methyltransferase, putative [Babesia ovis]
MFYSDLSSGRDDDLFFQVIRDFFLDAPIGKRVAITTNGTECNDTYGYHGNVAHEHRVVENGRTHEEQCNGNVAYSQHNDPVEVVAGQVLPVDEHGNTATESLAKLENTNQHHPALKDQVHRARHYTRIESEDSDVADKLAQNDSPSVLEALPGIPEGALDTADAVLLDALVVLLDSWAGEVDGKVDCSNYRDGDDETHDAVHGVAHIVDAASSKHEVLEDGRQNEWHYTTNGKTEAEGAEVVHWSKGDKRK